MSPSPIVESASQANTVEDLGFILLVVILFMVFGGSSSSRGGGGGVRFNPRPKTPKPNIKPKGQGKRNA